MSIVFLKYTGIKTREKRIIPDTTEIRTNDQYSSALSTGCHEISPGVGIKEDLGGTNGARNASAIIPVKIRIEMRILFFSSNEYFKYSVVNRFFSPGNKLINR
ncbi:MAG: hypothetical protein A2W93_12385 [Bacteroidetes bacterium GWF2_43_63]|nr:MAG: hypothetical protein A2W94_06930 [Bacteroidetes bacterium GWE2_42_42]OFY56464.1 MAG: hypothetical protein A2W93_12385 [Bacteroidetes bacterium GWF2_43_63]HBG71191.1 hypothetical protein [Bacteroidales bacterium]HCB61274.1 hypothetical protein [Bacteroidales bacterium]HCY23291.1 hypothetical protein [Bacteroidales bacterium]